MEHQEIVARNLPIRCKILNQLTLLHLRRSFILQIRIVISTGGNRKFRENKKNMYFYLRF